MTVTITPTVELAATPPRVKLSVSATGGVTSVTVLRFAPDGSSSPVRTDDDGPVALSGGTGLLYDPEVPYGVAVTYSTLEDPATVSSAVTVAETRVWLTHPFVSALSMPITVSQLGERVRAVQQGVFRPMGRATPVVITDGQRQAATYSLGVHTPDDSSRGALGALLDDAGVLLLNVPASKGWGIGAEYVSVGDVTEQRPGRVGADTSRVWNLPITVVSRPAGGAVPVRTLIDLLAYPTLNALNAAYSTLNALNAGP